MRFLGLLLSACVFTACTTASHPDPEAVALARGHEIAQTNCASCHAIGSSGESPFPEAPPFRTLSRNYRVDSLEEALAEGISVGHPAMPEFQFEPNDVHALVSYLQSIQEPSGSTEH